MRLTCEGCARDTLVAFSCKRRGICPSCGTRRMAETAADLVDILLILVGICTVGDGASGEGGAI